MTGNETRPTTNEEHNQRLGEGPASPRRGTAAAGEDLRRPDGPPGLRPQKHTTDEPRKGNRINLKTEPWAHQKEGLDFIRPRPGAMLAMKMGTGKSLCAVALMAESERQRTLVLCPLSVVDHVWPQQIEAHSAADLQVIPLGSDAAGVKAKLQKAEQAC